MNKSESLKINFDFKKVYEKKKAGSDSILILFIDKNEETESNRLGISVSKKVGNSVVRHHLTRLIRESYRLHEAVFNSGLDIVIVARPNAKDISYKETESALLHLGKLHSIICTQLL